MYLIQVRTFYPTVGFLLNDRNKLEMHMASINKLSSKLNFNVRYVAMLLKTRNNFKFYGINCSFVNTNACSLDSSLGLSRHRPLM